MIDTPLVDTKISKSR